MARKAKSWAEYRQWQKSRKQWDDNNVQHVERIQQTVSQDKGNERAYLYRPEVQKAFLKAPQAVSKETRAFYSQNPVPAATQKPGYQPRTADEVEADPRGDGAIRDNVLEAIGSQLLTPEQREQQQIIAADPEAVRAAIQQMMQEQGVEEKPALVAFLDDLMNSYDWLNQQITHLPKAAMIATNPNTKEFGDVQKAWEASDAVDFFNDDPEKRNINPHTGRKAPTWGQTAFANPIAQGLERAALPFGTMPGTDYVSGDPNDPAMQARFENPNGDLENRGMEVMSGFMDLAQQSVADGMGLAAKALSIGWKATRITTGVGKPLTRWTGQSAAANLKYMRTQLEASRSTAGKSNGLGEYADWLLKEKDQSRIEQSFRQRGFGDRSDIAHMFKSVTEENGGRERIDRLLLAGAGEPQAIKELYDTDPHYYLEFLKRSERANEWVDYGAKLLGVDKNPAGGMFDKDALLNHGWATALRENPDFAKGVIKSYADGNPALARELAFASSPDLNVVGAFGHGDFGSKSVLGQKFANKRAEMVADGQFTHGDKSLPVYARFIDSPISTAVAVLRWPFKRTPSGIVGTRGINKEGSGQELVATLEAPKALRSSEHREFKNDLMSIWGEKSNLDAHSSSAVMEIETRLFDRLANVKAVEAAQRKGLVEGTGEYDRYVSNWVRDKNDALKVIQKNRDMSADHYRVHGFDVDQASDTIVTSPQLQSHLREGTPILDFNILEKQLNKSVHDPSLESWIDAGGAPVRGLDNPVMGAASSLNASIQSVWRPLVLMRAAYPIRNTMEGYARVLGFTGFANSFLASAEQVGASGRNAVRRVANATGAQGRAERALTYESTEFDHKVATLSEARENLRRQASEIAQSGLLPKEYGRKGGFSHGKLLDDLRAQNVDELDASHPLSQLDGGLQGFTLSDHRALADAVAAAHDEVEAARPAMLRAQGKFDDATRTNVMRDGQRTMLLGDGTPVSVNDTFGGKLGGIAQQAASSSSSWDTMINANTSARKRLMAQKLTMGGGYTKVSAADNLEKYGQALDHLVNRILKDSTVMKMRLDPTKSPDDFVNWFYGDPAGRMEREAQRSFNKGRAAHGAESWDDGERAFLSDWFDVDNPESMKAWFEAGRENLLQTLPDNEFRQLVVEGNATRGAIKRYIDRVGPDGLPDIISDQVFMHHGTTQEGRGWWKNLTNTFFHYAGAVPETVLVRQPYYSIRQREFMDSMRQKLTAEVTNTDVLAKTMLESHRYAVRRLKRDIYTIERQRNLPKMVENVSPFWTAQLNTAATWPRIMKERPESLAAIARLYGRMRDNGYIDEEGYFNPIPSNPDAGWGNPGGMNIRIPFANIMSVFAGQTNDQISELPGASIWGPWIPNPGPYIQLALSEAQRGHPGFKQLAGLIPENATLPLLGDVDIRENVYKWGNSGGPSTEAASLDRMLPGWMRTAFARVQGEGNGTFDAYAAMILANETAKWDQGLRDKPPSGDEIRDLTNQMIMTLMVGQFVAPGSPRAQSPIYPMVLKAREFTSKHGYIDGMNKFLDTYGEEWRAALMHGTKNEYGFGVEQSKESWKILQDNPDLVRRLAAGGDTELVSLLMGDGSGHGTFDRGTRRLMQGTQIPGQDKNILESLTPEEGEAKFFENRTWAQFRAQYTTWRDVKIAEWTKKYGSTIKIPAERWAELKERREATVKDLAEKNPDWGKKYNARSNEGRLALAALKDITGHKNFADKVASDPYWQTVAEFVDLHDRTAQAIGGTKPNYKATTPEEYFIKKEMQNKKKGYHFSADSTAKYRKKIMKQFNTPGTGFYKQWQLAKYRAAVQSLKSRNVRFSDMHERWFSGEDYDDNAFIGG